MASTLLHCFSFWTHLPPVCKDFSFWFSHTTPVSPWTFFPHFHWPWFGFLHALPTSLHNFRLPVKTLPIQYLGQHTFSLYTFPDHSHGKNWPATLAWHHLPTFLVSLALVHLVSFLLASTCNPASAGFLLVLDFGFPSAYGFLTAITTPSGCMPYAAPSL